MKPVKLLLEYESLSRLKEKGHFHYSFTSLGQHSNNKSLIISRFFRLVTTLTFFFLLHLIPSTFIIQITELMTCQNSEMNCSKISLFW